MFSVCALSTCETVTYCISDRHYVNPGGSFATLPREKRIHPLLNWRSDPIVPTQLERSYTANQCRMSGICVQYVRGITPLSCAVMDATQTEPSSCLFLGCHFHQKTGRSLFSDYSAYRPLLQIYVATAVRLIIRAYWHEIRGN